MRRFVRKHAVGASFPEEIVSALQLAVDEACANVIEHAYSGDESNTIDVDVVVKSDRVTVRIRDEGRPFADSKYRSPDIFEYAANKKSGGFGVHLMRKLADSVEYTTRGRSNVCSLTMYRTSPEPSTPADEKVNSKKTGTKRAGNAAATKAPKRRGGKKK